MLADIEPETTDTNTAQVIPNQKALQTKDTDIQRFPGELDEDFNRRLKKHNFLKLAHSFAELKKADASVLPFDLHKYPDFVIKDSADKSSEENHNPPSLDSKPWAMAELLSQSKESFPCVVNKADCDENDNTKAPCDISDIHLDDTDSGNNIDVRTREIENKSDNISDKESDTSKEISNMVAGENESVIVPSIKIQGSSDDNAANSGLSQKSESENTTEYKTLDEDLCPFDVYNIETALPNINWETLEESLKKASEDEKLRQQVGHCFIDTLFNLITTHTPISVQSSNSVVFRLQPVYFLSISL